MSGMVFTELPEVYESLVDWPKRLAYEEPFYRDWFQRVGVRRVLDVASGTGHHAAMFHGWGLEVEAADLSAEMTRLAKSRFGEPSGLRWVTRGFDQPVDRPGYFDAALCVGNSLALAADETTVRQCVRQMMAAVRAGGLVVVQVLNLARLPDGPCVWQKCLRVEAGGREAVVFKGVHRCGTRGFVDLLVAGPDGTLLHQESVRLLGLEPRGLQDIFRAEGAESVVVMGGYKDEPFEARQSRDLVVAAIKG
jgi:SAM-dependent methyltransferase